MILLNIIIKQITKSKKSPIGWVLIGVFTLIGQACSPLSGVVNEEVSDNYYYGRSGKQIRYSPMGNWFELGNTEVLADVSSFMPLESEFAKDKEHIFFKANIIDDEVDIHSFRVKGRLAFDQDHVYVPLDFMAYAIQDTMPSSQKMFVIEGADPETYVESEDWDWGKDAKNWFYGHKMIDVDYASFTPVNDHFCKDDYRVYLKKSFNLIPCEVDAKTFVKISERYVADHKFIYDFVAWQDGQEVDQLNKFSYQSIKSIDFSHDDYLYFDNKVIYDGTLIEEANRKKFKVLESATKSYAKDEHHVFYDGHIIVGADLETFSLYEYDQYARDKNYVYHWGVRMEIADVETFGPVEKDGWIYRDKNHTYRGAEISEE